MTTHATSHPPAVQLKKMSNPDHLLEVKALRKHFPIVRGIFSTIKGTVRAVDDVDFFIRKSETLGLVGESGCGKTTVGRCIARAYLPTGGEMLYQPVDSQAVDLAALSGKAIGPFRRDIRMIFQDPYSSLNPRMTVFDVVSEVLRVNRICPKSEMQDRVEDLLKRVGLRPEYMQRYPHAFSGGERQRLGIARALALNPKLIVCDEPVSALDVSIQAQVINLLEDLQHDFNLTYIFVAHDLSVVEHISDRVAVMYVGRLVELAKTEELYYTPKHPYSEALMAAVPKPDPRRRDRPIKLPGEVASPINPPSGCYFHPRCRYAKEICKTEVPALREVAPEHYAACHFAGELTLRGITTTD